MENFDDDDLMDERAAHNETRAALAICVDALMKISEPRVGGGRWAAAVASEALDKLTCAGVSHDGK